MFMIRDWGEKRTTLGLSYMPTLFPGFLSLSPSKKYFCEEGRERSLGARLGLCLCFSFTLNRWAVRKKNWSPEVQRSSQLRWRVTFVSERKLSNPAKFWYVSAVTGLVTSIFWLVLVYLGVEAGAGREGVGVVQTFRWRSLDKSMLLSQMHKITWVIFSDIVRFIRIFFPFRSFL